MSFESDNPELELNSTDGFLFETPAGGCPEVLTEVELSTCDDVSFWIGNIRFAVVVAGVILNLESLFIFATKEISSTFNALLAWLAFFDFGYLLICFIEILNDKYNLIAPKITIHFVFISTFLLSSSIYLTVAVAVERFLAVMNPISHRTIEFETGLFSRRTLCYTIPVLVGAFSISLPELFTMELVNFSSSTNQTEEYYIVLTEFGHNQLAFKIAQLLCLALLPATLLIVLNVKIFEKLRQWRKMRRAKQSSRASRRAEERQIFALFGIVAVFVVSISVKMIDDFQFIANWPQLKFAVQEGCDNALEMWQVILGPITEMLLATNSAANFFVYLATNAMFQKRFVNLFTFRCKTNPPTANWSSSNPKPSQTQTDALSQPLTSTMQRTTLDNYPTKKNLV